MDRSAIKSPRSSVWWRHTQCRPSYPLIFVSRTFVMLSVTKKRSTGIVLPAVSLEKVFISVPPLLINQWKGLIGEGQTYIEMCGGNVKGTGGATLGVQCCHRSGNEEERESEFKRVARVWIIKCSQYAIHHFDVFSSFFLLKSTPPYPSPRKKKLYFPLDQIFICNDWWSSIEVPLLLQGKLSAAFV